MYTSLDIIWKKSIYIMYTLRERRNHRSSTESLVGVQDGGGGCARVESSIFDPKRHARRHSHRPTPIYPVVFVRARLIPGCEPENSCISMYIYISV